MSARTNGVGRVAMDNDGETTEIDLRERLLFAAGSLAADFDGELSNDAAEALVFTSAQGLLASAKVMEFVPILAERRARLAVRSQTHPAASIPAPDVAPPPVEVLCADPTPPPRPVPGVEPLLMLPPGEVTRLLDEARRARARVAAWSAELHRRS